MQVNSYYLSSSDNCDDGQPAYINPDNLGFTMMVVNLPTIKSKLRLCRHDTKIILCFLS